MGEDETRTLWCLVDGDSAPFEVTVVLRNVNIDKLKEAICFKMGNDLHDVGAFRLVLWKDPAFPSQLTLSYQMDGLEPLEPEDSLAHRIRSRGGIATLATRLSASQDVSTLFPKPPLEGYLPENVLTYHQPKTTIVAKRKRIAITEALPSEHSLHKLWMLARKLEEPLFETRPVQRDKSCLTETELPSDCMVLKGGDWVDKLLPDSRFTGLLIRDEYHKVLRAIMEWFLPGKKVTDDMQPAPWSNPFLDVPPTYVTKKRAFVLLGHPGIGKTAFLYVLLVLRLQARLPTIFQSRDNHLCYFDDNEFKSQFDPSTWCLIDSNQHLNTVPGFIQDLKLFIVQASSPSSYRFEWTKKATGPVSRYFMKSWTLSELLVGRVLQDEACSEAQIESFSNRYGTSARSVYTNAADPSSYHAALQDRLTSITYEKLDSLIKQLDLLEAVARLYKMFVRFPKARNNAGYMLEDAVRGVFPKGGEWCLVSMMRSKYKDSNYSRWKNPTDSTAPQYLHLGYMGRHIAIDTDSNPDGTEYSPLEPISFPSGSSSLKLEDGFYLPSSPSQPTFDAFIYESASKTATVFQVTTSTKHSVSEEGINSHVQS
ncbi:hypothetical protein JOM56_009441 [Amanita muscaria]